MHRSKKVMDCSVEYILNFMEKHNDKMTESRFAELAQICRDFNHICKSLEFIEEYKTTEETPQKAVSYKSPKESGKGSGLINDIADELSAAEKYIASFETTKNIAFKALAKDELKHADTIIKMINVSDASSNEQAELQQLINQHRTLTSKVA